VRNEKKSSTRPWAELGNLLAEPAGLSDVDQTETVNWKRPAARVIYNSVSSGWSRILLPGDILPVLNDHPRQLAGKQAKTLLQSCPLLGAAGEERYRIARADQVVT
jgi:hypothetical protein